MIRVNKCNIRTFFVPYKLYTYRQFDFQDYLFLTESNRPYSNQDTIVINIANELSKQSIFLIYTKFI